MGFGKTHKYYKKYLYSLWVLPKPINTTKINLYSLWVLPKPLTYTIFFVVFMGFDHLYRFEVTHICITKGF